MFGFARCVRGARKVSCQLLLSMHLSGANDARSGPELAIAIA
jgi:hypothetical protein